MSETAKHEQVAKGEISYSFVDFMEDLKNQVRDRVGQEISSERDAEKEEAEEIERMQRDVLRFVYDVCFKSAVYFRQVKSKLDKMETKERNVIVKTIQSNADNIRLLRAIFKREIAAHMKNGMSRRQATKTAIQSCKAAEKKAGIWIDAA
jgi:hypothetical protein